MMPQKTSVIKIQNTASSQRSKNKCIRSEFPSFKPFSEINHINRSKDKLAHLKRQLQQLAEGTHTEWLRKVSCFFPCSHLQLLQLIAGEEDGPAAQGEDEDQCCGEGAGAGNG